MVQSIYLAGSIGDPDNDWRFTVVERLDDVNAWSGQQWPVLTRAVGGCLNYVGPYSACTCGHRCGSFCGANQEVVHSRCLEAIRRADIFFAWLDSRDAYGTLVEIGYAAGLSPRPHIIVATGDDLPDEDAMPVHAYEQAKLGLSQDLWFAIETADLVISRAYSADSALNEAIDKLGCRWPTFDSPIEVAFWEAHAADMRMIPGLVAQHKVLGGRYRLDFAVPHARIAIELDGYEYHSSREAFVKDRQRQRHLEALGWRFIRFAGIEVMNDAVACYRQAAGIIRQWGLA